MFNCNHAVFINHYKHTTLKKRSLQFKKLKKNKHTTAQIISAQTIMKAWWLYQKPLTALAWLVSARRTLALNGTSNSSVRDQAHDWEGDRGYKAKKPLLSGGKSGGMGRDPLKSTLKAFQYSNKNMLPDSWFWAGSNPTSASDNWETLSKVLTPQLFQL